MNRNFAIRPPTSRALQWRRLGRLTDAIHFDFGGVYLLVHEGRFKRVIYVGTTRSFTRRMAQHLIGHLQGIRPIWRISREEDVYELMSAIHLTNYVNHYKRLAERDLLWGATTLDRDMPINLLARDKPFTDTWHRFVVRDYLPNISVWACKLEPYQARTAVRIESAIQQRLAKLFSLGRFFNHKDLSLLGKIEFNDSIVRIKSVFENVPDVDDASKLVFSSLGDKNLPQEAVALAQGQLASVIAERLAAKQKRADARTRLTQNYPNAGKPWNRVDLEKLRVMLVDFEMSPAEMVEHLGRRAGTIRKKIDNSDKLTGRLWRSNVALLQTR